LVGNIVASIITVHDVGLDVGLLHEFLLVGLLGLGRFLSFLRLLFGVFLLLFVLIFVLPLSTSVLEFHLLTGGFTGEAFSLFLQFQQDIRTGDQHLELICSGFSIVVVDVTSLDVETGVHSHGVLLQ
jgi:hypothetical protein